MDFLLTRILASAAVDTSLAILCGLLLARGWLRGTALEIPTLRLPAGLLCLGGALQLLSLTASFTGKSSLVQLGRSLPDIIATHPGTVLGLALAASILLLVLSCIPGLAARTGLETATLVLCLLFRSGTGHAATEKVFSRPQAMQFLHLTSMSVWSGGVLIAGLVVLPRMQASKHFAGLLAALSRTSTWALAGVLVSGAYRGYTGIEGDFHTLLHTPWGLTLSAKLVVVAAALALGASNRLALGRNADWPAEDRRRTTRVLRAEAYAMLAILALSATLANLAPPGD